MDGIKFQITIMMLKKHRILILIFSLLVLCSTGSKKENLLKNKFYLKSYLLYLKGDSFYKQNKLSKALNYYKKARKIYNKYPEPFYKTALIHYRKRNIKGIKDYLERAYQYKEYFRMKDDLYAFYNLCAEYYEEIKDYKQALQYNLDKRAFKKNSHITDYKIGYLYYKINENDMAYTNIRAFINNKKSYHKQYRDELKISFKIIINILMDKKDYKKALYYLKKYDYNFPGIEIKRKITILSNNLKYHK